MPVTNAASITKSHQKMMRNLALLTFCLVLSGLSGRVYAQQQSGCFSGKDSLGYPANVFVSVERYGDWFQITGQIYSSGENRLYKFSADGHSGAGRLYLNHEYEAGAVYIDILNLTEQEFVINIESYGTFRFVRTNC